MSFFKVKAYVKSIGSWDKKIFVFAYIFKGSIIRVLEVLLDNHFYANWN